MLKNYLTIIVRNILRYKQLTAINVLGLAVGMASFFTIVLYLKYELSFDKFNHDYENIYRINFTLTDPSKEKSNYASSPIPLKKNVEKFEGVKYACRFSQTYDKMYFSVNDSLIFTSDGGIFADSSLFDVFTFQFLKGDKNALNLPNTMVLTRSFAIEKFGTIDLVGKTYRIDNQFDCKIMGVINDIPSNSHFSAKFLISFSTAELIFDDLINENWFSPPAYTFIRIEENSYQKVEQQLKNFVVPVKNDSIFRNTLIEFSLTPLTKIHLFSHLQNEFNQNRKLTDILFFSTVALSILLIACFNFINLSTAMAFTRAKETGIRKVMGASRQNLIFQFLGEAQLMAFASMGLSFFILEVFIPVFNKLLETNIVLHNFNSISSYLLLISITILTGLFSGIYPAILISGFNAIQVLKGVIRVGVLSRIIRKILVTAQFTVTIVLIISTIFIFKQVVFFFKKSLGFDADKVLNVLFLNPEDKSIQSFLDFKEKLLKIPDVESVTFSMGYPFGDINSLYIRTADGQKVEKRTNFMMIDSSFFEVYKIKTDSILFPIKTDSTIIKCFVNQTFIDSIRIENPVGKRITLKNNKTLKIVGVVSDFHYRSLAYSITPLVLVRYEANDSTFFPPVFSMKVTSKNKEKVNAIVNFFQKEFPTNAVSFSFIEEKIPFEYRRQMESGSLLANFALISIAIALLGLMGLVAFTSKRRTKEIGIRKANGAFTINIILMLIFEHLQLVFFAIIVGFAVSYFIVDKWLDFFAYRIPIIVEPFLYTAANLIVITSLIVVVQAYKAASRNPVESLKYE